MASYSLRSIIASFLIVLDNLLGEALLLLIETLGNLAFPIIIILKIFLLIL